MSSKEISEEFGFYWRALKPGGRRYRFFRCVEAGCGREQRADKAKDGGSGGRCNCCLRMKVPHARSSRHILRATYPCCGTPLRADRVPKTAKRPGFRCRACKAAAKSTEPLN